MDWYQKSPEDVLSELSVSEERGLSQEEAKSRLDQHGRNELKEEEKKPFLKKLAEQFLDPMIIILLLAALISGYLGETIDAIIIMAIVVVNAFLSIYQEGKAEEAISQLKKMSSPKVKVRRDGRNVEIESPELVPGDIVLLEAGDIVPADMRLISTQNLKIDESSLTGESVPVEKRAGEIYEEHVGIGDRKNYGYSASIVTYGRGMGVVTETGESTEIGKIAESIRSIEDEQTPLQRKLAQLSKFLGILTVVICIVVFGAGIFYGHDVLNMFLTSISLAVAAIPEGLPAIVTIVLSLGMRRMADKNAIVKKLLAVETLGTTTFICSDKTGTLTQNAMTVRKVYVDGKVLDVTGTGYAPEGEFQLERGNAREDAKDLGLLSAMALLNNDAKLEEEDGHYKILGDPTEGALVTLGRKFYNEGQPIESDYERIEEIPFDSDRKMMSTFHEGFAEGKITSFTKGAPDLVIEQCSKILVDEEVEELTEEKRKTLLDQNLTFANDALRVLAFAYREHDSIPAEITPDTVERELVFVGLVGMIDPPRDEVRDAVAECRRAGIEPVMITGDYLATAVAIAKDLGILDEGEDAMRGADLEGKSEAEMREIVKTTRVFARVSPENKVQIVRALRQNNEITAMTGDGVNDAPAIKQADIGIAMGITGTDVTKSTADVILTDDNFATIVHAVEEGRVIFDNIKKFVSFLLSCNIGEVLIVFLAIVLNQPAPFTAIQLLWMNLVTDSFPALALGVENPEAGLMDKPPRDPDEPLIDKDMRITILIQSLMITLSALGVYLYGLRTHGDKGVGLEYARSMAFATLIFCELLRSFSVRSFRQPLYKIGVFSNRNLVIGVGVSLALTLVVLFVPALEDIFGLVDMTAQTWGIIIGAAFIPLIVGEIQKMIRFGGK